MPLVLPNTFGTDGLNTHTADLDANFAAIVAYVNGRVPTFGTLAARPAPGNAGALYITTDENDTLYVDDGAAWQAVGALRDYRAFPQQSSNPPTPAAGGLQFFALQGTGAPQLTLLDSAAQLWTLATSLSGLTVGGSPFIDVNNTTAETTLVSRVLKGGELGTNRKLLVWYLLDFLQNTGGLNGFTLRAKYGGTTGASLSQTIGWNSSATRRLLALGLCLTALGATNAQAMMSLCYTGQQVGVSGGQVIAGTDGAPNQQSVFSGIHSALAIDDTVDQNLDLTVQPNGGSVNLSIRLLASASMLVT